MYQPAEDSAYHKAAENECTECERCCREDGSGDRGIGRGKKAFGGNDSESKEEG